MKIPLALASPVINLAAATLGQNGSCSSEVGHEVHTTSGIVIGKAAPKLTAVSEYLGIPYAKPPVGNLRFAAPERFIGHGRINATSYSPDCPANINHSPPPPGLASNASYALLAAIGQAGNPMGEDCLSLNIWTKPQTGEKRKAVLLFIHGGGWQTGSTNDPQINGQYFAENQDVVVVTINYRLNIFGFPGLPGMDQNIGLLDQRAAVEWVHDNIAQFGGDPNRITLFGQSAGSASIDLYSFAWTSNPLVNGFIEQSGTSTSFFDPALPNNIEGWYNTTAKLDCGDASTPLTTTVACMRTKPYEAILTASAPTGLQAFLGIFNPTTDNKTVFSDYSQRSSSGQYIQKPYLIGSNDYEAGLFKILAAPLNLSISNRIWSIFNQAFFSCPADAAATPRADRVSTYRYRFFGEYPDTRLTANPDSGAWHGAEIPIVWGTTQDATNVAPTPVEARVSKNLNAAWAAFAKDPVTALSQPPFSWPKYSEAGNTLIRLGYGNETTASFIGKETYDQACPTLRGILTGLGGQFASLLFADEAILAPLEKFANLTELGGGSEVGY